MIAAPEISGLSNAVLRELVLRLLGENTEQKRAIVELREEIARLKGLKGRPDIKPSGMEQGTTPRPRDTRADRPGRGKVTPRVSIEETLVPAAVPPGSRFRGYEDFVVQDVVLRVRAIRYRRERWVTPDGRTVIAPLPPGVTGHFGPELRRFVLAQYHKGQVTVPPHTAACEALISPKYRTWRCTMRPPATRLFSKGRSSLQTISAITAQYLSYISNTYHPSSPNSKITI